MTKLVDAGKVIGEPTTIAKNSLMIVVKPGNPNNIQTLADLNNVGIVSLCGDTVPCGKFAQQALDNAGVSIPEDKVTRGQNATATIAAVAEGDADAGIVYVTDVQGAGASVTGVADSYRGQRGGGLSDGDLDRHLQSTPGRRLPGLCVGPRGPSGLATSGLPGAVSGRGRRRPPFLVVAAAVVALAFFVVPLVGLLRRADWGSLWGDLTTHEALTALRLSVVCSLGATALAIVFGVPLAWVLARTRFPGQAFVRGVVLLPMVLPPVVGGVALLAAFSRSGTVGGWLYDSFGIQLTFSTAGVILAETFVAMPFLVITVEGALRSLDARYEDVAATLGAGRATVFRRVTLPLIAPSLLAGAVLAWARALGEFGATITFAGNIEGKTRTIPLAVYLAREGGDSSSAIALSIVLLVVSLAVLVALRDRWFVRA